MSQTSLLTSPSSSEAEWEWVVECPFDPPHVHTYPADWQFGGANGTDPRADPRFKADTYTYWDDKMRMLYLTSKYKCDDEAIDDFTWVAQWGNPVFIQVTRHGTTTPVTLPVRYNAATDEVYDV